MTKLWLCLVSLCVFIGALTAVAQVQNGQFQGTVTDPTGAAIAGAKVTITNQATNVSIATTTNQSGLFIAKELPIGTYTIRAEASGFKTRSDSNLVLNAGVVQRVDMKMDIGQASTVVEVSGQATAVQVDDPKLYSTVSSTEISNLVLNGRNVFDLMQIAAGAVNVSGTDFENGHNTVVNGVREDFNGFLINGVSNKGLSGGEESTPIQDTVEEFQQLGLNMSAQYGNSAGSTVNLVTKAGTNNFHGSLFYYGRNDYLDANEYFLNQAGAPRPPLRWNQFGGTFGGPIIKDKLFFFVAYEGSRFITSSPSTVVQETPDWRKAVATTDADTNTASVANLLYSNFKPSIPGQTLYTVDQYVTGVSPNVTTSGFASYADYMCADNYTALGYSSPLANLVAARMQNLFGTVPSVDNGVSLIDTGAPCSTPFGSVAGHVGRDPGTGVSNLPFQETSAAIFKARTSGNFFNGKRYSGRIDYNWNAKNRVSGNYQWQRNTDEFGPCDAACDRGFSNPQIVRSPNAQFSYVHTFSPTILNEFRAGYAQNVFLVSVGTPGVPQVSFDDGSLGFGSYNGYPQYFKENIYSYSDMVSITRGNHNMKVGVDFRRNIENSEFDIARGSYYFSDPIFFAADLPYDVSAGVNPGICTPPCSQATIQQFISNGVPPNGQLSTNIRHWRNLEFGAYFQDDWKATKRLTLQLGLRYDLFTRHHEENNLATTFIPGPGSNTLEQLINANQPPQYEDEFGNPTGAGCDVGLTNPAKDGLATLAGVCGTGGFAPSSRLGKGRHHDFGPRIGFAWDLFGNGKTALRGGFGLSYEGTLYNPLSNSRWNLPYYSFNELGSPLEGLTQQVVWGPTTCSYPAGCSPVGGALVPGGVAPTYNGAPTNPNQGTGAQATGNINGYYGQSPNAALLTGIIFPQGVDDPYVYNYYLGFQHEILPKTVLEVDYVGTTGHKLFRAEDINRAPGTVLPVGSQITNNVGEVLIGYNFPDSVQGRPNPNYGRLRTWENVVNSNYSSLQASVKRQMSHGLLLNVNYTYAHSIDNGSTWHSGATTANGAAGGEGFTTDPTHPQFDRGNSIFDIRHRLVINHVWQLPGQNLKGALGYVAGGWSLSGIWAFQTGAHWQPYRGGSPRLKTISSGGTASCQSADVNSGNCENLGGDYLLTRGRNERPDSSVPGFSDFSRFTWANGWFDANGNPNQSNLPVLSSPCLGCLGTLGRNTFVGPGFWQTDMTLAKNFKLTERVNLKFEFASFNIFNRANFLLAGSGGGGHNDIRSSIFGEAATTQFGSVTPRIMQYGLKLGF